MISRDNVTLILSCDDDDDDDDKLLCRYRGLNDSFLLHTPQQRLHMLFNGPVNPRIAPSIGHLDAI